MSILTRREKRVAVGLSSLMRPLHSLVIFDCEAVRLEMMMSLC